MIEDVLWQPKARREMGAHPIRPRRDCLGDQVPVRLLGGNEDPLSVEDGKSVRSRVDRAKAE